MSVTGCGAAAVESQRSATAYLKSKPLLPFCFARKVLESAAELIYPMWVYICSHWNIESRTECYQIMLVFRKHALDNIKT